MPSLCVLAYVFGNYDRFIPYFLHSALSRYPECRITIVLEKPLSEKVERASAWLFEDCRVKLMVWQPFKLDSPPEKLKVDYRTILRFIVPERFFQGCRYGYITDIDILFMPSDEGIVDFHAAAIRESGLPFNNIVRPGSRRLTGLHFIEVERYYASVGGLVHQLAANPEQFSEYIDAYAWDEEVLFSIVRDSCGNDVFRKLGNERPWFGLHLGAVRKPFHALSRQVFLAQCARNYSDDVSFIRRGFQRLIDEPGFMEVHRRVREQSISNCMALLGCAPPGFRDRLIYWRYRVQSQLKNLLKSIRR